MRRPLLALGVLSLLVVACVTGGPSPTTGSPQAGERPVPGGRIVEGVLTDVQTMQPTISQGFAYWGMIYQPLFQSHPVTGDLDPVLAEKYEVSPDGKTVTFTLRPNVVWSDGTPLTGEDYKYTVEAIARAKASIRKSLFLDVVGWQDYATGKTDTLAGLTVSPDGRVITVRLNNVSCAAPRSMTSSMGAVLPKHLFVSGWNNKTTDITKTIEDHPLNMRPPASIGPFMFKEHIPGVQLTLVRNERFWRGAPLVEEYIFKVYSSQTAIKAALLTGEVSFTTAISPGDVAEIQSSGGSSLNFYRADGVLVQAIVGWNHKSAKAPWLADKRVRQALWHALDVKTIIDKVLLGYAKPVVSLIPVASAFYEDPGFNKYEYDINKAKALLEQAGSKLGTDGVYRWTNGQPMQMRIETLQGDKIRETIVQIVQEQYAKVGIKIETILEAAPALSARTQCCQTDWEGALVSAAIGVDPDSAMMGTWHSRNITPASQSGLYQYRNADVDKAAEAGRFGPDCSVATRKKLYTTVTKAFNEDAVFTMLYTADQLAFANKTVRNFDPKPYFVHSAMPGAIAMWNVEKWWIQR